LTSCQLPPPALMHTDLTAIKVARQRVAQSEGPNVEVSERQASCAERASAGGSPSSVNASAGNPASAPDEPALR
jgi:hypothetical protein